MNWTDEHGTRRKLWASGAARLKHVAERAPVGRLQTPATWQTNEVRNFQDQGLWNVTWLDAGDVERKGSWRIDGLTEKGRKLLAEWERRVEEGGGLRGPKRGGAGTDA
ncbi:hypothetical protein DMB38_20585 [Streptomyces sp. WAC 06738]|nr:hypothetical protein DMB38_20585 [Streptomyces sp. WAC 06738]